MTLSRLSFAALAVGFAALPALAQPAPITYATSAGRQYAALPDAAFAPAAGGGVLDLTRPTPLAAPDPDVAAPAVARGPRPAWLEQERVGPPYEANGRTYVPTPEPGYSETGIASWYGPGFHGQAAANGSTYDQEALTAAHPTLPLNSLVQVTNLENGRELILRVTDRGPFVGDRLIDVSHRAADVLGFQQTGTTRVHVRYLGPAPRRYTEGQGADAPVAPAPQAAPFPSQPRPAMASADGAYVVQIGAYGAQATAERVRDAVQSAGSVRIEPRATAAGGQVYRVRLGGFDSRADAETARQQVASLGYPDAVIAAR